MLLQLEKVVVFFAFLNAFASIYSIVYVHLLFLWHLTHLLFAKNLQVDLVVPIEMLKLEKLAQMLLSFYFRFVEFFPFHEPFQN